MRNKHAVASWATLQKLAVRFPANPVNERGDHAPQRRANQDDDGECETAPNIGWRLWSHRWGNAQGRGAEGRVEGLR